MFVGNFDFAANRSTDFVTEAGLANMIFRPIWVAPPNRIAPEGLLIERPEGIRI